MGRILTDTRGLVTQPKDPYWDAPLTRREMQVAVNQLSENDMALTNMMDTMSIVLNFILEDKLGVKDRTELDKFVVRKKAELEALRTAAAHQAEQIQAAQQGEPTQPEQPAQTEGNNGPDSQL